MGALAFQGRLDALFEREEQEVSGTGRDRRGRRCASASAFYALSLRRRVSEAAVEASFERSVERVDGDTSGHVPKRPSEEEVIRAAADFETFYETRTPAGKHAPAVR